MEAKTIRRPLVHPPVKCFGISVGMHVTALFLLALFSSRPQHSPPVIIDLTLDTIPAATEKATVMRKQPLKKQAVTTLPLRREPTAAAPPAPLPAPQPVPVRPAEVPAVSASMPVSHAIKPPSAPAVAGSNETVAGPGHRIANERAVGGQADTTPEKARHRYLKEHFTYIRDLVMKRLVYPGQARKMGWSGKVMVSFLVCEDGSARDVRVVESSGHGMLDRCAVNTILSAAPFPKPPLKAEIVLPIQFKLM